MAESVSINGVNANKVLVLTDTQCSDALSFGRYLSGQSFNSDLLAELQALDARMEKGEYASIIGLTRGSTRFLIEQYAHCHGYHISYEGEHAYDQKAIVHRLSGSPMVIDNLAAQLEASGEDWARQIASSVELLCQSCTPNSVKEVSLAVQSPVGATGHLVSWMLRKTV
ncbi:hypothetical protein [Maricurvus nonylphenolicus]|uniref:hypothetical protein n=1 Tax=Maricurvus nonylphenolicus TaxID=1008307 RepID=UPI0036F36FD7